MLINVHSSLRFKYDQTTYMYKLPNLGRSMKEGGGGEGGGG